MTLETVFLEFNRRLSKHGRVAICGGAVRDSLMGREPKDWDIFVLHGGRFDDLKTAKESIIKDIADLSSVPPVVEWHNSEPFLVANIEWNGVKVQILANPQPDLKSVVDTFDWNVCMFGYDGETLIAEPIESIGIGKPLRLNRVTFPASTLRRGFRFSERFTMRLELETIEQLCREVIKKADAKKHVGPDGNEPDAHALAANTLID